VIDHWTVDEIIARLRGRTGHEHLKSCTEVQDPLTKDSRCVKQFYAFLKSCSSDECEDVARFITGASHLPLDPTPNYIQIQALNIPNRTDNTKPYPMAATCANTLYLGETPSLSQEEFNQLFNEAIRSENGGFHVP